MEGVTLTQYMSWVWYNLVIFVWISEGCSDIKHSSLSILSFLSSSYQGRGKMGASRKKKGATVRGVESEFSQRGSKSKEIDIRTNRKGSNQLYV